MKNVLLYSVLFSALFFFQSCGNTTTHPDLRLFHLKGKVKSLKYRVSSTKDATSCVGIGMGKEYTPYYVYEFSKEGEWINPKNDIERNSEGFIIKAGLHEFEWDDKGRLQNRRINDIYGSPIPEDYIAYYYNNDNIVDSLQHNDGGEYGYIHRYYRYLYIRDLKYNDNEWIYVQDKYEDKKLTSKDLVVVNTGNTAGEIYYGKDGILSNNLFKVSFDNNVLSTTYMFVYFSSQQFQNMLWSEMKEGTQPHLGHKIFGSKKLLVPPIELQNQFAVFVEQVDKSKLAIQKSIDKLETLKKSLMQQYFG